MTENKSHWKPDKSLFKVMSYNEEHSIIPRRAYYKVIKRCYISFFFTLWGLFGDWNINYNKKPPNIYY